jgi:aldehyde dehydrogenase (NAD+)
MTDGRTSNHAVRTLLRELGVDDAHSGAHSGAYDGDWLATGGDLLSSIDPATGEALGTVRLATRADYERVAAATAAAFAVWRTWPAPKRGEVVRALGNALREHRESLGRLVSREVGKIRSEGLGEVQEMIDMADLAVGISRQLYGKTMPSERAQHRMYEQWHPLGPVGIISAFNFPVAVWAWNACLAAVCGDAMIWKPSLKAPLAAIATTRIAARVLEQHDAPPIFNLVIGSDGEVGEALIADRRLPLVSATGSVRMGRHVNQVVAARLGRTLLELGGNNGIVVLDDADLELAVRAIAFAAAGTAGQRCTTSRRLFAQRGIARELRERLVDAFASMRIGDPEDSATLVGPLIDADAVAGYRNALDTIQAQGGQILHGGRALPRPGFFVEPTLVAAHWDMPITHEETFAPILYCFEVDDLDQAIAAHNAVPQGLSSAIFTDSVRAAERFLSATGSDCGIANVNIGTSGAEIGGAFGGEKETGGGREAGSDSWQAYMRRQTCTINWGTELPLAQGVRFDVDG